MNIESPEAVVAVTSPSDWDLFLVLPNLKPPVPTPFMTNHLCVCSGRDPLLEHVADTAANRTGREMLSRYQTWFGRPYMPACLLVHRNAPEAVRTKEALRGFRNIAAIASLTHSVARKLTGSQWVPPYSDFFLFAAHVAGKNGWIGKLDGVVGGMDDEVDKFRGQCDGQIDLPEAFTCSVDKVLFKQLVNAWESFYLIRPSNERLVSLFRSLEVAFHAARFPSDGLTGINDAGVRIGLWVSAFEVLCHPGSGRSVDKPTVQTFLTTAGKALSKFALKRRRYRVTHRGRNYTVALMGLIYEDLYSARNAFMHGNPVEGRDLQFRRVPNRPSLFALAPLVYNVALRNFLNSPIDEDDELEDAFMGLHDIEEALETALRGASRE